MPSGPTTLLASAASGNIPGAVLGAAQTAVSLINAHKAKVAAKELERTRPKRQTSPLIGQNLSLAESELAGGMSSAAETAYNNAMDRQQAGSLSALLRGGGDVNSVSDIYASGEEGRQRLSMLTDQLRLKQIDNVVSARNMSADEADKNFLFNQWALWADKSQANAKAREGADKGIWSGLNTVAGAATNFLGGKDKAAGTGSTTTDTGLPDGQKMWEDYLKQQQMDNAPQGNYTLQDKWQTHQKGTGEPDFNYFDPSGLYNYLNRGM